MLARTEPACLVIADISGYSGYLAEVELDHAQDVLADLIGTVVGALRAEFKLAKLEGDAAFVYLAASTIDGHALQDVLEGCYFAFRRRLRDIRQASACECNACIRIPDLDLKFVAHHGTIARQRMAGLEELVGTDVILVHRLLKNGAAEALGLAAYILYTDTLARAMGLADPAEAGLVEYRETYESVGDVVGWVADLHAAWRAAQDRERVFVADEDAIAVITTPVTAPPAIAWDWATSPVRRLSWSPDLTELTEDTPGGRRGIGTVNHCMHGKNVSIEEVVDWRPPHYMSKRITVPMRGAPRILITMELVPHGDTTDIVWRVARPKSAKDRLIIKAMEGSFRTGMARDMALLVPLVEADAAARASSSADEPPVPESAARHLTEPIVRRDVDLGPVPFVILMTRQPVPRATAWRSRCATPS